MTFTLSAQSGALYLGGMFGFSLLATALVAVVAHPAGHFNRLLTNPFFLPIWVRGAMGFICISFR